MALSGILLTIVAAGLFGGALGDGKHSFTYHGEDGPEHWAEIFHEFCGHDLQSPINIERYLTEEKDLGDLNFSGYDEEYTNIPITNDGHTVRISLNQSTTNAIISGGGLEGAYQLSDIHFHWGNDTNRGSEHTVDGKASPIEMHMVHRNVKYAGQTTLTEPDSLAVVGVLFEESSSDNPDLQSITNVLHVLQDPNLPTTISRIILRHLLPANTEHFYRYRGSLTTPTCDEIVTWTVFEKTKEIGWSQLSRFRHLRDDQKHLISNNFRPTQPLNGRHVFKNH